MSSDDEMNALDTRKPASGRGQTRKKQRTASPDPSLTAAKSGQASTSAAAAAEDDEIMVIESPSNTKNKGKARQKAADPAPAPTSKSSATKGKEPHKRAVSRKAVVQEPMDVDEAHDNEESENDIPPKPKPRVANGAGTTKKQTDSRPAKDTLSSKELDRWKQKVTDLEAQRDTLTKQLEEVFRLRNTEPEEALEQLRIHYDSRVKTQDALIKELTSQLARAEPLARTKHNAALHFMTREAADEEKRAAEEDNIRLKDVINQKDATIAEEKKRNTELQQSVKIARQELDAEIERSKELIAKASRNPPPSVTRSQPRKPFGNEDPKNTEVIKFYEDISNLLVTSLRFEPNPEAAQDDTIFTCVYTYVSSESRDEEKSITFTLRMHGDDAEDDRRVKYTPLELDKESPTFVRKLDFLNDAFTFPSTQQALFLTTMRDKLGEALQESDEEEDPQ
ncbi:hypothetical protein BV22DRAFT_1032643 [Leucogyrophana mollusca]|uniref:Uncharacterized protein n=1 Tax=Leucogyrophana mollusca TaxID=85980 RepID=A0ACB8BMU9_9AGAM|nr:hypothetical protein BV22DRAFT_1032643 [Leucogyrophana mollusca]